jgi:hypothetical protein
MPPAEGTRLSRWPMHGTRVVWQTQLLATHFRTDFTRITLSVLQPIGLRRWAGPPTTLD